MSCSMPWNLGWRTSGLSTRLALLARDAREERREEDSIVRATLVAIRPYACPMPAEPDQPDWERLLAAERHLQALLPSAVLVGGTAASLHTHHRISADGDHVLA